MTTTASRPRYTVGARVPGHGWPIKVDGVVRLHTRTRAQATAFAACLRDGQPFAAPELERLSALQGLA
jgi:hypothetical protein